MALKHCMLWSRPSRVLGLFFGASVSLLLALAWWQTLGIKWLILGHHAPRLSSGTWCALVAVVFITGLYLFLPMTYRKMLARALYQVRRQLRIWFRPSRMLVVFFLIQLGLFIALGWWQKTSSQPHQLLHLTWPHLTMQNWVVLAGVEAAVWGWVVTSYMTLRNSIKQHTINTLLQSRLSATYMAHATCINEKFFPPGALTFDQVPLEYFSDKENFVVVASINYLLNYFEFLSAAARYGDLDETLLRGTMGGILCRFYDRMMLYIKSQRGDDGNAVARPQQLEHCTWLYERWKKAKDYEQYLRDDLVKTLTK